MQKNGKKIDFKEGNKDVARKKSSNVYKTYSTYLYTQRIKETLEKHSKRYSNQPFFLLFSPQSPHTPFQVPKEYQNLYKTLSKQKLSPQKTVMNCIWYYKLDVNSMNFKLLFDEKRASRSTFAPQKSIRIKKTKSRARSVKLKENQAETRKLCF